MLGSSLLMTIAMLGKSMPEMTTLDTWYQAALLGKPQMVAQPLPLLEVKRQDYNTLKLNHSIWGNTPIVIGSRTFLFRRAQSPFVTVEPHLHGIDPQASYAVGYEGEGQTETMSGAKLLNVRVTMETAPDSRILTYKRK